MIGHKNVLSKSQFTNYMSGRFGAILINQRSRELHRDNIWVIIKDQMIHKIFNFCIKDYLPN